jgi:Big-like domain-containing protein
MTRPLVALLCLGLALAAGSVRFTSAAFTASTAVGANSLGVDQLSNHFSVVPAGAVQAGTSTPVASGSVDSLSLDFGTVPSARTFTNVFRVTNVGTSSATATLSLSPISQIVSIAFASSGSTSATLAPGASTTLSVTTSPTVAGRGTGTVKLGLGGVSWMYRTYSVALDEAPEAPGAPTATATAGGQIGLSWGASTTTTNLAGYDLYRSSGGAFTKLNTTPLAVTTYTDTATVDGTTYTYKVRATSSGAPTLQSLDSATITATADATPPGQPTSVSLANGGGAGSAYINGANAGSISISVGLAANSLASDVVTVTLSNGSSSVTQTAAGSTGAGTITVSGLNAGALGDGTITISAKSTDRAGNVSTIRSATVTKDTAAPGAPIATYTDNNNSADQISGTAEANAAITITETAPGAGTYSTTASAGGAYSRLVSTVNGKNKTPITVTYVVTATDAAGNVSAATTVTYADTR